MKDLSNYRRSYEKSELVESALTSSPIALFSEWFNETEELGGVAEVNTMTLSTLGADGFVHARIVLLKQFSKDGFTFYTNYLSQKGRDIANESKVCLSFFWPSVERQVIITGEAKKVSDAESDEYFATRPRGSQLGAWASQQSSRISSRDELEKELRDLEEHYAGQTIPRPKHWGGFLVVPHAIEFWQGRPNRLHDRIRYSLIDERWTTERLSP